MYLFQYVNDCKRFMKWFPLTDKGNKRVYYRNVLYINAQETYLFGRIMGNLIRFYDSIYHKIKGGEV